MLGKSNQLASSNQLVRSSQLGSSDKIVGTLKSPIYWPKHFVMVAPPRSAQLVASSSIAEAAAI